MAVQTRDRILLTARTLFNQQGFHQVTMRQIAEQCGISPGNLTYHFRHKTDIVTALMDDSFGEACPEEPITTLTQLMEQFRLMLEALRSNAFFFLDDEINDAGAAHNSIIRRRILDGMERLTETGVFTPDFTRQTRQTVLDLLLMAHISWLRMAVRGQGAMSVDAFLHTHEVILQPYLAAKPSSAASAHKE